MFVVSPTRYVTPQAEHASRLPLQRMLRYARRKGCKAHASTFDKRGTFEEPTGGGGGLPPFRVTVPSVDVDWAGFAGPADENGEEARFVVVPLNTNKADDIRGIKLHDPFDDDQRNDRPRFPHGKPVHPDITLHWEAGNPLALLGGTTVYTDKIEIDAGEVDWPLDYAVIPRHSAISFAIAAEGQAAEGGKAVDIVHGRVVDVDLDVDANHDGKIDDDDEPPEENPGGYACVCTNKLTPLNLTVQANRPARQTQTLGDGAASASESGGTPTAPARSI
jgi:hypothetical protein